MLKTLKLKFKTAKS